MPGMDALVDSSDLCCDRGVLACKNFEAEPCGLRDPTILLVSNDLEQLGCAVASLRRDNAELGQVTADRVRQHRSLPDQELAAAMQHQTGLLLLALGRHKTHRRTCHCLADRRSVIGVILAALEIGLHVTGRHQPHRMAECLKLSAPMMGTRAGFNANEARRQSREELQHLGAAHALADHNRAIDIHAVDLKHRLRNIQTNRANLAHGRLPSMWFALTQPPYGTSMPQSGRRPQHHKQTLRDVRTMSALPRW